MTKFKKIKDLKLGDVVAVVEPAGFAKVTKIERSMLFNAEGGCFALNLKRVDSGEMIRDQHHAGLDEVEVRQ